MQSSRLIINADDFGHNSNTNAAIVSCFENGFINSTTILVNMDSFQEAILLAEKHRLKDRIGIHINLTEGKPLTDLRGTGLIDDDGNFLIEKVRSASIMFSPRLKSRIKKEIFRQYDKLIANGINPTHIDSHQHMHHLPWIAPLFFDLASKKKNKLRLRKTKFKRNFFKGFYTCLYNSRLKRKGLNFTDLFGNVNYVEKCAGKKRLENKTIEMVTHPVFSNGKLTDRFHSGNFGERMKEIISKYKIEPSFVEMDSTEVS